VRWTIAGVFGVGAFVNYVDRVNLSIAGPEMMRASRPRSSPAPWST
jgi:ACS family D-galactonate transporter-like MFS transporter